MSYSPKPLEPLYRTLADAGYTLCRHPRVRYQSTINTSRCEDCGASHAGNWLDGVMDYPRKPLQVS